MDKPLENYWRLRLEAVKAALEANHFEVRIADTAESARRIVLEEILPATGAKSIAWGGSMTVAATGLYAALKEQAGIEMIDTLDLQPSLAEKWERRRRALLCDLFITGTNAVTEEGQLVNLDMWGNRVAAIAFGPNHVVIIVGRNKITADIDDAMFRVKSLAAPANAMRLDKKTPCAKTAFCEECRSPDRICNAWTITEKSYPKGRIKVVLVNQDLGL